jgi:hypothetical protein
MWIFVLFVIGSDRLSYSSELPRRVTLPSRRSALHNYGRRALFTDHDAEASIREK